MPQKRNPDVPELARGKVGRVTGHLVALLTLMKAQPLAYNKDNQEDKEPLFDTVDTVVDTLRAFAEMLPGVEVDADAMRRAAEEGYSTATDLADYLVEKCAVSRRARGGRARGEGGGRRGVALSRCRSQNCRHIRPPSATTSSTRYRSMARWLRAITGAVLHRSGCTHKSPSGGSVWRSASSSSMRSAAAEQPC